MDLVPHGRRLIRWSVSLVVNWRFNSERFLVYYCLLIQKKMLFLSCLVVQLVNLPQDYLLDRIVRLLAGLNS